MASNLNKAFMRAYAKDRSTNSEDAQAPAAPVATAPTAYTPAAIVPAASPTTVNTAPAPAPTLASPMATASPAQPANPPRMQAVVQPSMEPTVFAGRYAPPQIKAAPRADAGRPSQTVQQSPVDSRPVQPAQPAKPAQPSKPAAAMATHRIPAPNIQPPAPAPDPQPRVVSASARPTAQPQPMRREQVEQSETGEASRVWQRIDAAHGAQAIQPTETQTRPTVAVGTPRTAAPKRMQAAAAPAPVAPTAPQVRIDTATPPNTRQLPLVGDEIAQPEPQQAETRRRTVADFLYSAGQYNPGRVLASAESVDDSMSQAGSATAMPTAPSMRSSDMVRPIDRDFDNSLATAPSMSGQQSSHGVATPMHAHVAPVVEEPMHETMHETMHEPMPRRMGQILRVDVPRNQPTTVSRTEAAPAGRPAPVAHAQPSMPVPPVESHPTPAPSLDAPVAKYVLEQRRMDRAHKLNEVEEKLRNDTHKIFNPVWEVDSLQWPAVVDKLMQQRAQSMSHVAEHLKTACQDGLSILGVTSAHQSEGRTTVACCLARLAAAHGLNVALVDIDLDHPTLCIQTNMEVEHDWRDCLNEDISLEEVAVHSIDDQLTVLPLKPRGGRPGLLASDARIADILKDLAECFELVIVDCSKTNSSGNVITGLAHTKIFDAAIVVVDRRDGEADRVEDAVRMIQQTGIESIGIVDNFSM